MLKVLRHKASVDARGEVKKTPLMYVACRCDRADAQLGADRTDTVLTLLDVAMRVLYFLRKVPHIL